MNVYDFDKTIYDGDSATNFFLYSVKKNPSLLRSVLKLPFSYMRYKMGTITRTKMKESLYRYVTKIDNLDEEVKAFWELEKHKIKGWYYTQKREDDLIISASPEFLIQPICDELGLTWMASKLDVKTGKYNGSHCYAHHKVDRYREFYSDDMMDEFYSDSLTDTPLAQLAKKAYFVKGNEISDWPQSALNDTDTIYE